MSEKYIPGPRPQFRPKDILDKRKRQEVVEIGGSKAGIMIIADVDGLHINGKYEGFTNAFGEDTPPIHSTMMDWAFISWKELDELKEKVNKKKKKGRPRGKTKKKKGNSSI